jgi:hypothetical protein
MRKKKYEIPALEGDPKAFLCEISEQIFKDDPEIDSARGMWKIHCEGEAKSGSVFNLTAKVDY